MFWVLRDEYFIPKPVCLYKKVNSNNSSSSLMDEGLHVQGRIFILLDFAVP